MNEVQEKKKDSKIIMLARYVYKFGCMVSDNYTAACAAQAAFFIMLSIVPLVSLILAVGTYLPFSQQDVLNILTGVIPKDVMPYVQDIINDLYTRAGSTVISVSAVAMIWSASKGIASLMDGFNSMYQLRREGNVVKLRMIAIVYTVILIVIFVAVTTFYTWISHYYRGYINDAFEIHHKLKMFFLFIRYIMGWLLYYLFILMMFVILPGDFGIPMGKEEHTSLRQRIETQAPGAAFAAVAWLVITEGVKLYLHYFSNYSVMYGSLAGLVIAMLWLYFCMYSLFIGAVLNYLLSKDYLTRVKKMLQ
jgi:membrane protein